MIEEKEIYNKEYFNKLDKELVMAPLIKDDVFKSVMMKNTDVFEDFLIQTLDLKVNESDRNMIFLDKELPKDTKKEKGKNLDIIVKIGKNLLITIEMNRSNFNNIKQRNEIFFDKLNTLRYEMTEEYRVLNSRYLYQLNLNAKDDYIGIGENIIVRYDLTSKTIYNDNAKIYLKHLEYYYDMYYTNYKEMREDEIFMAALMSKNFTELYDIISNILSGSKLNRFMESVINMSKEWIPLHEWAKDAMDKVVEEAKEEELKKRVIKKLKEELREEITTKVEKEVTAKVEKEVTAKVQKEVTAKVQKETKEENTNEIIKSMIINKADYEFISKVTNKNIEEIKEIENSMNK